MKLLSGPGVLAGLFCLVLAGPAWATFSCEVAGTPAGGAALLMEASQKARVIRSLKNGAMVSLFDDAASRRYKGWSRVAHSATGEAAWGAGDQGWIETRYLKDCG